MATGPLVTIIDDDESVRESLPDLVKVLGYEARAFAAAEEFLASDCIDDTRCLVLDITMPGMSGPDLQNELRLRQRPIPIIMITGRGDKSVRSRIIEQGAVECLIKPFSDTALCEALKAAFSVQL